jgi:hypothetical protein
MFCFACYSNFFLCLKAKKEKEKETKKESIRIGFCAHLIKNNKKQTFLF